MDPRRFSAIAHGALALWNPLEDAQLARTIALLPRPTRDVLDVGCGPAEILARVLEARAGARGVGVDPSPFAIARARANLEARGLAERATLIEARYQPGPEAYDVILCVGATHAVGDFDSALRVLGERVRPGGRLVVGEGYWRGEPAAPYLEFLGANRADYHDREGNLEAAGAAGWRVLLEVDTSLEAWDRYEDTYAANVEAHLAAHPDDPDAGAMRRRIEAWRGAYLRWGRESLGFGLYVLGK